MNLKALMARNNFMDTGPPARGTVKRLGTAKRPNMAKRRSTAKRPSIDAALAAARVAEEALAQVWPRVEVAYFKWQGFR